MAILVQVNWYKVTFPVVSPINHVFKFFHLSCVRVSVAGKGDKWNSKKLVTVTSNHRWELNRFHLAYQKTPGSHLRSEGSRRGRVYCVKMRKKCNKQLSPWCLVAQVYGKKLQLCFYVSVFSVHSVQMDGWLSLCDSPQNTQNTHTHCTAPLVLSTYFTS